MEIDPHLKKVLALNDVSQIGIVVRDMEKTINNYSEIFGISFPKIFFPEYFNLVYRGKPGNFRIKVAVGMMGKLEMELIQVLEGESLYQEFLEKNGEGLHHVGFDVENVWERAEALQKLGIDVLLKGERAGARFAYMNTQRIVGIIVEFYHREIKLHA